MMLDMTELVRGLDGEPLMEGALARADVERAYEALGRGDAAEATEILGEALVTQQPVQLRAILCNALMGQFEDERALPGAKKVERYTLAQRLLKEDSVELTSEQTTLLKDLVAKGFTTVVVGAVWAILDPACVTPG